ncbi:hypothetical protein JT359_06325 [Candidatus Poribacteria bacterium]|nr:hypothetical protein [Candidatus Poribacteria bacterium]
MIESSISEDNLKSKALVKSRLIRAIEALSLMQKSEGNFEGELSSSTFPSCAVAWIQLIKDEIPEESLIKWFIDHQSENGAWGLDTANQTNPNSTLFVRLILEESNKRENEIDLEQLIARIPEYQQNLGLVKLAYASLDRFDWEKLSIPKNAIPLIKVVKYLSQFPILRNVLKPPRHKLPPVDLFNTSLFEEFFIAEQHTLVPVFILIELNTTNRIEVINSLVEWLKSRVLGDGSWFRVNYITALSVLALIEVNRIHPDDSEIPIFINKGMDWLKSTKNQDGGYREAINLNVWDTALSIITLTDVDELPPDKSELIQNAAQWLVDHQNQDGGWAFSGMKDSTLPSDADDTALGTLALIRSKLSSDESNSSVDQGINWLLDNQGSDGSWSTYQPGIGDVGCVSITSHAIEALLAYEDNHESINRGIHWLQRAINSDGYWDDLWLAKRTYGTACAIVALVKAGFEDVQEITKGVRWLEQNQNADGGWGEDMFGNPTESTIEQTAWSTYALLSIDNDNLSAQKGIQYIIENQHENGTWKDSCVGIYWEIIGGYSDPIYASVFPILALNEYLRGKE